MAYTLQIKNLVCNTCKLAVRNILDELGIAYLHVSLGEAVFSQPLSIDQQKLFEVELKKFGFELIERKDRQLVNSLKSAIIKMVYEEEGFCNQKLSEALTERFSYDYSYLSHVFSALEGLSIREYHNTLIIERTKELLEYGELNMNEIAMKLGYNSAGYLSTKFKKAVGHTPSEYQKEHLKQRKSLDVL